MPRIAHETIKPILPIVYVIEASDNMAGERIAVINEAMRECQDFLAEVAGAHPEAKIRVAAIKYGDTADLLTNGFEFLHQFDWEDISAAGQSNIGAAIDLLNNELLQDGIITSGASTTAFFRPIVLFLTASPSTDDYTAALSNADKNANFHFSLRICVAIGDGVDKDMLANISGNIEAVVSANDLETLKCLFVAMEMPEREEIEDFIYENTVSKLPEKFSSIVKVDGIENRDNFYLEGAYGSSVSVIGSTDVARCQCGPCEPEAANDVMFHIDDAKGYLKLTNSENIDDLYVSFYVGAKDERTIVGCCKSIFAINSVSGDRLDSAVIFEIEESGIKISNGSSGAIYLKAIIDAGMCTPLLNHDIIQNANDDLLTVRSNKVEEIISGLMGDIDPTSIDPIDGDLGGWDDNSDWS